MSSHSKRIGDIGQAEITARLLHYENIIVSKPVSDNEPYDLIVDIENKLYRVQVKTTETVKNNSMIFAASITNPFKKTNKRYTASEIDWFMLYCVENNYYGLVTIDEYTSKEIVLRLTPPLNNNFTNVKMASMYALDKRIQELITTHKLSSNLLTRKQERELSIQNNINPCSKMASEKQKNSAKAQRKVARPGTYAQFKEEMEQCNWNYCAMARKYGVTDNAIRKWERYYQKYENVSA